MHHYQTPASSAGSVAQLHDGISAFCASVGAAIPKSSTIYRRLSALGRTGGTVSETLKEYIREGRKLSTFEMIRCMKELRKDGHYHHELEMSVWMEKQNVVFLVYDYYVLRLDHISKAQVVYAAESYFRNHPKPAKNLVDLLI